MTNQNHEKNEDKAKMSYLMIKLIVMTYIIAVVLFSISGCKEIQEAPISHIYVIDTTNGVCSKRKILDKKRLTTRFVEDLPIEACDGFVSLTAQEYLDLRAFIRSR